MELKKIWKCKDCGLVIEVLQPCDCEPECKITCCGNELQLMEPKTADFTTEKHVPIPAPVQPAEGLKVVVGSVPHPMLPEHYIEWIEIIKGDCAMKKYLKPGDAPEAVFPAKLEKGMIFREFCNVHGLWKYEVK